MAEEHYQILEFERPIYELKKQIEGLKDRASESNMDLDKEISLLEKRTKKLQDEVYRNLTTWQMVQIMRQQNRPKTLDYINMMFTDFYEMHGDRSFGDDKAIIGGMAMLDGMPVMVIGLQKGKDTRENILRRFGCALPEGYRKALRLMKFAEKFGVPVITFIDTNGAYPGIEGEERGVAEAIARNLFEMSHLKVPIIVNVIGEGGSGGALGIGVGDRVLMLKYAFYCVISPEGCASILWKDPLKAPEAAKVLKPTAKDLLELKVIDEIIEEPLEGAHTDPEFAAKNLKAAIIKHLDELMKMPVEKLLEGRYEKFRNMGIFTTDGVESDGGVNV